MILIYGADKNLMENIKLLDHNQPVVVLADNGRHGSHDKKKRRMKSCSRKLKHVLEKLDQRKLLIEMYLSETMEDLSMKLYRILKYVYKDALLEASTYFVDPLVGEFVCYKNDEGTSSSRKNSYDVIKSWCTKNNNNKTIHGDIRSYDADQFKSVFPNSPDIIFSAGSHPSTSFSPCCKLRKADSLKVVSWPLFNESSNEAFGLIFLLVKSSSQYLQPALDRISPHVVKTYQKIMSQIENHQKYLILNDLGTLFTKDIAELSRRIINKLTKTLQAESGIVLLVNKNSEELSVEAFGDTLLNDEYRFDMCDDGLSVLYNHPKVCSMTIEKDSRIAADLQKLKDYAGKDIDIQHMLVVPAFTGHKDELDAIFCLFNKKGSKIGFTTLDEELMSMVVDNCRHIVSNALDWKQQTIIQRQNESLLDISKTLFRHLDDVSVLLHKIMEEARNLTKAERCSLFLVDHDHEQLVAEVFDGVEAERSKTSFQTTPTTTTTTTSSQQASTSSPTKSSFSHCKSQCTRSTPSPSKKRKTSDILSWNANNYEHKTELRISIKDGIAGHVATTGETLNIKDAYSHPLFYKRMDEKTGFRTKHILCFPIRSVSGGYGSAERARGGEQVIGVAQLCNKINGNCFTKFDEERTTAFAIFVGLSLVQSLLYKKATQAQQRSKLANELMLYHMRVSHDDIQKYTQNPLPIKDQLDPNMDRFSFMPRVVFKDCDSIKVVLAMFTDLDLVRRFKIHTDTLVRFILTVRRSYRDVAYHNWTHAWTVAHFSYILLKETRAREYINDLEVFVLLVACLCHDVDHRGTNNSFQISSQSVLASLYSSAGSVLEEHHFVQTMCIIQTEFCNIFESLSESEYSRSLDLMHTLILATDLANHFKMDKDLNAMIKSTPDKENEAHRVILLSLFMTTSDLSDQTKPWQSAIKVSDLLYEEFFAQGDTEKQMGCNPMEMMDRDKASIPHLQLQFLKAIVEPIYEKLAVLFPRAKCILTNIKDNRNRWSSMTSS